MKKNPLLKTFFSPFKRKKKLISEKKKKSSDPFFLAYYSSSSVRILQMREQCSFIFTDKLSIRKLFYGSVAKRKQTHFALKFRNFTKIHPWKQNVINDTGARNDAGAPEVPHHPILSILSLITPLYFQPHPPPLFTSFDAKHPQAPQTKKLQNKRIKD